MTVLTQKPQVWKTHRRRDYEMEACPHCGAPLKWVYLTTGEYAPCDHAPVLFMMHPEGRETVIYKGEPVSNCIIYRKGDERFARDNVLRARVQHYYTCPVLKNIRLEYAKGNNCYEK